MMNHAVVCSDVGIVAMRTFIEMTADSFTFYAWFCKNINNKTSVYFLEKKIVILVDPARGHCYQGLTKPCESRGFGPRHTAQ